ncbi:MAG: thiol:disulfide interchange protein [Crocinitomicaceae bacterium]|jgi:thiol:disulfide interchange protein
MRKLKKYSLIISCLITLLVLVGCGHQRIRFVKTGTPGIEKRVHKESRFVEESIDQSSIRITENETAPEEEIEIHATDEDESDSYDFETDQSDEVESYASFQNPEDSVAPGLVITPEIQRTASRSESNARTAKLMYIVGAVFFWTIIFNVLLVITGSILLMLSSKSAYITSEGVRQSRLAKIALVVALSLLAALILTFLVLIYF